MQKALLAIEAELAALEEWNGDGVLSVCGREAGRAPSAREALAGGLLGGEACGAVASPLKAVGDGQEQLALFKSLHLLESLVVQCQETAAGVLKQAFLGRVEFSHLSQLFWSHNE